DAVISHETTDRWRHLTSPLMSVEREYTDVLVISSMRSRKNKGRKIFCWILLLSFFNWVRCKPVGPRRGEGRMGVGVFARLQHTPGIRQWDPRAENWVPMCVSIWGPGSETGSRSSQRLSGHGGGVLRSSCTH